MTNVKTAVSIDRALFDQIEDVARELKVSRSRVFALALTEFIRRRQNRQLLERLNAAHEQEGEREGEPDDSAERARLRNARRAHRKVVEGEW